MFEKTVERIELWWDIKLQKKRNALSHQAFQYEEDSVMYNAWMNAAGFIEALRNVPLPLIVAFVGLTVLILWRFFI